MRQSAEWAVAYRRDAGYCRLNVALGKGELVAWRGQNRAGMGAAVAIAGGVLFCTQALFCRQASADTLEQALAYAYVNNPQLNSQRAVVRATDEGVPTALAGYRPKVSVTANAGTQ